MNGDKISLAILRGEGTLARAVGASILDNPCYLTVSPGMTDEKLAAWDAQAAAWQAGWLYGVGK